MPTDGGKNVTALSSTVLSTMQNYSSTISAAANAAGVSALEIAAPIAREMNKADSGDYNFGGLGGLFHAMANVVAIYGPQGLSSDGQLVLPLTNQNYVDSLNAVESSGSSNTQSAGGSGVLNRLTYPTLEDLGAGHMQLGTAMNAVSFYVNNPQLFSGTDPLNLQQYVNNTPQLAQDLINPSTTMNVAIALQAVIAVQANNWGASHIAGWDDMSDADKAQLR
jgi:hypothetical protein